MLCKSTEILDEKTEVKISKKYLKKNIHYIFNISRIFQKKLDHLKEFFVIVEKCK